jgi:hypothetical protein
MNILDMRAPQGILNNEHTLSTRRAARTDELSPGVLGALLPLSAGYS